MIRKSMPILMVVLILLTPQWSLAGSMACTSLAQQQAFKIRALQNELMVGALACNEKILYNNFMKKFKHHLAERGILIKNYFIRNYPKDGTRHLNTFITQLANEASKHSLSASEIAFCDSTRQLFSEAMASSSTQGLLNVNTFATYQTIAPYLSCTQEARSEYTKE